jgi:anhydro-N-acetylmuramic acid kinase
LCNIEDDWVSCISKICLLPIEMEEYRIIGLMSGTSLDGLDVVDVSFFRTRGKWKFELHHAKTYSYSKAMRSKIALAPEYSALDMSLLSVELSRYYGEKVNAFISENIIERNKIDAIASHGQTIFHQPEKSMTLQIGNTPHLTVITGLKSVVDFRTEDVAYGGNGAPLIPVADFYLFSDLADGFLNIGGFSNLSFQDNGVVRSYDVSPANIVINHLVNERRGILMDKGGEIARKGKLDNVLFDQLEALKFYKENGPKSLGWEWVESEVLPLLDNVAPLEDQLNTYVHHISKQIGSSLNKNNLSTVMVTGGGAHNHFLMETLQDNFKGKLVLPEKGIIDFKEAVGFAFLGLLKSLGEVNVFKSVTGALKDTCSGVVYTP